MTPSARAATPEVEPGGLYLDQQIMRSDGATGTFSVDSDSDTWVVWLRPGLQIQLNVAWTCPATERPDAFVTARVETYPTPQLKDLNDVPYSLSALSTNYTKQRPSAVATTLANAGPVLPSRNFITLQPGRNVDEDWTSNLAGCTYTMSITGIGGGPTGAVVDNPPVYPTAPVDEPNDTFDAATPITADTIYNGVLETNDDKDVLAFPVRSGATVDYDFAAVGIGDTRATTTIARIPWSWGAPGDLFLPFGVETTSVYYPSATTEHVTVTGSAGTRWQLRVGPSYAIGGAAPVDDTTWLHRSVRFHRTKGGYSGRVVSPDARCFAKTRVLLKQAPLRRKARRQQIELETAGRTIKRTTTSSTGTWSIRRKHRVPRLYALVQESAADANDSCVVASSRTVR